MRVKPFDCVAAMLREHFAKSLPYVVIYEPSHAPDKHIYVYYSETDYLDDLTSWFACITVESDDLTLTIGDENHYSKYHYGLADPGSLDKISIKVREYGW